MHGELLGNNNKEGIKKSIRSKKVGALSPAMTGAFSLESIFVVVCPEIVPNQRNACA